MYIQYTPVSASSLWANSSESIGLQLFLDIEIVPRWRVTSSDLIAAEPWGNAEADVLCFFVMMLNTITVRCAAELFLRPR